MNRRNFIQHAGVIGAGAALGVGARSLAVAADMPRPMKLLVLGGTGFIGPPMVRYAVERGHEVTIFTRGSRSDVPGVEHLTGDRNDDLEALRGRTWDAVLDNNARDYRWVELSTDLLKDNAEQYMFVSTISAYAGEATGYEFVGSSKVPPQITTESPLAQPGPDFEPGDELPYGPTKAMAEKIAHAAFPGRTTVVRPGFIVGPGDPTDRFTYWPVRIDRGGDVLAPGDGTDPVQFIDVRDLCEWIVRLMENRTFGNFNGVGIGAPISMAGMLYGMRAVTSTPVNFNWVPVPFLMEHEVQPYTDMPIWIPGDPLSTVDNSKAIRSGLTFRTLATTAADTLAWHRTRPQSEQDNLRIGIDPEREQQVLAAWKRRNA